MINSKSGVILSFLGTITLVIVLSLFVTQIFGGHSEKASVPKSVSVGLDMTIIKAQKSYPYVQEVHASHIVYSDWGHFRI